MMYRTLAVVTLGVVFGLFPVSAYAQTSGLPNWTEPEELGPGWFPNLAVDATGAAHITWHNGNILGVNDAFTEDLMFYVSRSPNGEHTEPVDVIFTGIGGYTLRTALDIDSHGVMHAFYRARVSHHYAQAPANNAASATQWKGQEKIGDGYYLDMLVDRDDNIHLVSSAQNVNLKTLDLEGQDIDALREQFPCVACSDLLYYVSRNGGRSWSLPVNLSNTIAGSERPQIFQGRSGRIYVAWSEGFDWYIGRGHYEDVRFVYSDDAGKNWQGPVILDGGEDADVRPTEFTLAELDDGSLLAVWRYGVPGDRNIYYQITSDLGQTWTEPTVVPYILADTINFSDLDRYELLVDLQGIVHLFAVGYDRETNLGPALYELTYRQGRWLPPTRIYYDPNVVRPEWPQADVGPANDLHLAFFVRTGVGRTSSVVGEILVYYTNRPGNLTDRPVLAAYSPTATVLPAPTEVPEFLPTPTLLPTLVPLDSDLVVDTTQDLYAIETLLGAVFAVGLLCVAVLVLAGFRPRL